MRVRLLGCASALYLASACGHGPDVPPDANAFCVEAQSHDDLAWIQDRVFTPSCAGFSACHQGTASEAAHLSLEDGVAAGDLVGVDSEMYGPAGTVEALGWKRVVPGDPDHSYLLVILGQKVGPIDPHVGTMPYNSPLLCQDELDAIERWIAAGANP